MRLIIFLFPVLLFSQKQDYVLGIKWNLTTAQDDAFDYYSSATFVALGSTLLNKAIKKPVLSCLIMNILNAIIVTQERTLYGKVNRFSAGIGGTFVFGIGRNERRLRQERYKLNIIRGKLD